MATHPTGSAAQTAHDLTDKAKDTASGLVDQAKDKAGGVIDQAMTAATDRAEAGKEQATGVLADVAEALHATSDTLHDNDQDAFAKYADVAARQVEAFTEAVRGRSVGDLLDEAERFARREPSLFLGGAFLLGIFGARFLKAADGIGSGPGGSARGFLSSMTLPSGSGRPSGEHVANVNRPPATPYGVDEVGGFPAGSGARAGGLTGGNLPANNTAAAGTGSIITSIGTPGMGAEAPVRSGVGAGPLSGEIAGTGMTGRHGSGADGERLGGERL